MCAAKDESPMGQTGAGMGAAPERGTPGNFCARSGCDLHIADRMVVLIDPDGEVSTYCGPYCPQHTADLLRNLRSTYTGGGPCYRIEPCGPTDRIREHAPGLPDFGPSMAGGDW